MAIIITQPDGKPMIGNKVHFVQCGSGVNQDLHAKSLLKMYPEGTVYELTTAKSLDEVQTGSLKTQLNKEAVLRQIQLLEAGVTPRMLREASIGDEQAKGKLIQINDEITALRAKI